MSAQGINNDVTRGMAAKAVKMAAEMKEMLEMVDTFESQQKEEKVLWLAIPMRC